MKQFFTLLTVILLTLPVFAIKAKTKPKKSKEQITCERIQNKVEAACREAICEEQYDFLVANDEDVEDWECEIDGDGQVMIQECAYDEVNEKVAAHNEKYGTEYDCSNY